LPAQSKRKPIRKKKKSLEEISSEKWIEGTRKAILDSESSEIDKPNDNFSRLFKIVVAYKCFHEIVWEYAPPAMLAKILRDTEKMYNRLESTWVRDKKPIAKYLTERHEYCIGSYFSIFFQKAIVCGCPCHQRTAQRLRKNEPEI
jgi:hypothetical protein